MPPALLSALADRSFVFDGSPAWTPEHARRVLAQVGSEAEAVRVLGALQRSAVPVPREWLGDRLTILWTLFMASRSQADPELLTLWLSEHLRLLADLPHDIAALAIDRAVQSARHGFIPSIGEMRSTAEPLVAERARMIERLQQVVGTDE
ncbi:hypothetical protein [Sphingomonas sp. Leaf242]|uniref:hypothetical protein n=1 Tax=Sphingomonas sp. Leaf242 TaxID=1736304 RepID=UPI000715EB82|nr:hypothetical protein [Sphingomonas sp. Leaf242]KQO13265.1 hypothetical protein ASF09_03175 [Sphingomonas sp. Leaf242]